jgi:DNA-directed RNA polymerase alpha subunit
MNINFEKYVKRLLFETKLFDLAPTSPTEHTCINWHLKFEKNFDEIKEECEIEPNYIMPSIRSGLDKVVDRLRQIILKNEHLEQVSRQNNELKEEVAALRERFQKELEGERQKDFPPVDFPISAIVLSTRTRNVLASLNIKTVNDLRTVTVEMIEEFPKAGQVTFYEIEDVAKEYGIELMHASSFHEAKK